MRHYYAVQHPRGFRNEFTLYAFTAAAARGLWVKAHADDGDTDSAARGADAITTEKARRLYGAEAMRNAARV